MKITLKLFANLREGREKEEAIDIDESTNVEDLIYNQNLPLKDIAIIMVNGRRVDGDRILEEGDTLSLFPPVGGG